ncbi:gibberellic acid methyltransferase 2 isoform X1 [Canna indica]|uniref:Gibberellic acid methyltransferase 2 isoform X1 n=1 Tax=Canna indica TaxID=4628 RepID=A0AAQ3KZN6_9LILI|nr:gibberellic acid methyltransferase 2 isoform X1 [Canna indica]
MDCTNPVHVAATATQDSSSTKIKYAMASGTSCSSKSHKWTKELHRILCMQGGDDDSSYAKNSEGPAAAISSSTPLLVAAIRSMKLFAAEASIRIADLGCATGYNTLAAMDLVVHNLRRRYEQECADGRGVPEFEAFFCDLPSNDFNSLFRSLSATDVPSQKPLYYPAGVPGSFYERLFPREKLHLVVSLNALNWLSKIPAAVLDEKSKAWNKGRVWIDGARKEVVEAYAEQAAEDLRVFLRCRKEEMKEGGMLFIVMGGRERLQQPENQLGDPDSRAKHPFTTSMDRAWQDLLIEGLIDEETRDMFNIPAYMRSVEEVKAAFEEEGSGFEIQQVEFKKIIEHSKEKQEQWVKDPSSYGRAKANLVRAALKPIIAAHIGDLLSEELFKRFERRISEEIAMLHKTCFYGIIIVCAFRTSSSSSSDQ